MTNGGWVTANALLAFRLRMAISSKHVVSGFIEVDLIQR